MNNDHGQNSRAGHKRTARLFRNGRNQAVRLPREYEIQAEEVYIERSGGALVLTPKPQTWDSYFAHARRLDAETQTGAMWVNRGDDRATAFGRFIRRTSLDELPQFFNVLSGEMSIVGPRPERPVFVEQFKHEIPGYMQKHMVKAGITGWAQVNGWRGRTDLRKRIEHDLYYIENWSLWFDLKIIFLTVFKGFVNKNAY